ncbi:MAG: ChaN family lipoprotein [Candidatus Methylomirabilia bacterium]
MALADRTMLAGSTAVLLLAGALLAGSGCASGSGVAWETTFGRDHPLTGRIWDVSAASFLDRPTLASRLARGRFVLLGEKHDNPDHHGLQAGLLRSLITVGRRPAVGFEMFSTDDAPAIARHLATAPTDAAGLAEAVHWDERGWPDWVLYQPIAEAALEAGLPIVATNLSPATARTLGREGVSALDRAVVVRLDLDRPLPPDIYAEMAAEIREAHCGYVSGAAIEAMVTVQRARDAQMAESLVASGSQDGAVLVAGAGHVRNDRGIPAHLAARAPGETVISLAFVEVGDGETEPPAYARRFGRDRLPFDYVWFTPRLDDLDPCEKFRKELERLRKPG